MSALGLANKLGGGYVDAIKKEKTQMTNSAQSWLIAKTLPRPHANGAIGDWHCEYRIRQLTNKEIAETGHTCGRVGTWTIEHRYVHDVDSEYCQGHDGHDGTWRVWSFGRTPKRAILDIAGDTQFQEAISLNPLHSFAIRFVKAERARHDKIHELRSETHFKTQYSEDSEEFDIEADEKEQAQAEYDRRLRQARLRKAASEGKAPQHKIDAIKAEVRAQYLARLSQRRERHNALMIELNRLEKKGRYSRGGS